MHHIKAPRHTVTDLRIRPTVAPLLCVPIESYGKLCKTNAMFYSKAICKTRWVECFISFNKFCFFFRFVPTRRDNFNNASCFFMKIQTWKNLWILSQRGILNDILYYNMLLLKRLCVWDVVRVYLRWTIERNLKKKLLSILL